MREAVNRADATQWTAVATSEVATEFDTVGTFANAAAAEAVTVTKQTYAGRPAAVTRINAIPNQMEIIRAVWANKHSGNPGVNAGIIPELKGIETAAKLAAKFPNQQ